MLTSPPPLAQLPYSSAPGTPRFADRVRLYQPRSLLSKPRIIFTAISLTLLIAILLPERHRSAAHSALTAAGVPLPSRLPPSLHSLLNKWGLNDSSRDLIYVPSPPAESDRLPEEVDSPHTFHSNGHLVLHSLDSYPGGVEPHPILALIKRAEGKWGRKVARQSRTLKEGVEEYRRRYKRNPPVGFDKW